MVQPPSGRGRIRTSRLACARSLRSRSPSGSANASHVRARRSNSSNDWPIASSDNAGESRSNTLAGMRGLAAIRAINSDWATPTRPSASASAHSGNASCRRAVWTRRCASGPDSLHMCFTTVFADRNPCLRNGFDRSTTPAAAIAAASTVRRNTSTSSSQLRSSTASNADTSTSNNPASAADARPIARRARSAADSSTIEETSRNRTAVRTSSPNSCPTTATAELIRPIMTRGCHRVVGPAQRSYRQMSIYRSRPIQSVHECDQCAFGRCRRLAAKLCSKYEPEAGTP